MGAGRAGLAAVLAAALWLGPAPARAADAGTLADVRTQLAALSAELARLRRELAPGGTAAPGVSGSLIERAEIIEAELARLTARTEALEFRLDRALRDVAGRLRALELRLAELAGGSLPPASGLEAAPAAPAPAAPEAAAPEAAEVPQLAVGERADFERARAALQSGDLAGAAALFGAFVQTYPGGDLAVEALLLRGEALAGLGELREAARAYVDAFSAAPEGPRAAEALVRLGESLGRLGQLPEACLTLAEAGERFPGTPEAARAAALRAGLSCG